MTRCPRCPRWPWPFPSLDFVRLGCGRVEAGEVEAAGGVEMEGDAALGKKILGAMNFMF